MHWFRRATKSLLLAGFVAAGVAHTAITLLLGITAGVIFIGWMLALAAAGIAYTRFRLSAHLDRQAVLLKAEQSLTTRQVQALFYIFSVVKPRRPLPPMREMAISPDFAATLVSVILKDKPRTILEFGSGVSTLLAAYCLEEIGHGRIISVEHEEKYAAQTIASLHDHGLESLVKVIHAPLCELSLHGSTWKWYDTQFLSGLSGIDLVVVDGPPAWIQESARYPALPLIVDKLSRCATVLLDDAARPDELAMVRRWESEHPGFTSLYLAHEKGAVVLRRDNRVPVSAGTMKTYLPSLP